ncbi:type IX secretion system membrane protein PorP/SprF [Mariniphaga sediminis]|uniref:Type IX secretion system membrane protein PorP/SprF n=1 Tax=Mariniphaga sediminis TaxID=1628158 RepID=A0A399D115_9BACT|nr:type IX secretion system membrane protein PorP/SprF [Mariniphaga sediminis]RIH64361.1 type IX secretion system membrane protein PorP/SprF [Mariniphaga sediminis]
MRKREIMRFELNSVKGLGVLFLFLLIFSEGRAQQDPMFTQYNFNTQTINPAYAGTWDNIGFLVLGRHQWMGMEGAPQTYTFSMQTPTKFRNVAVGFNVISDRAGFEKRLMANFDYSYQLKLNRETSLRLGLKGGINHYTNNLADYTGYPGDPADPMFMSDTDSKVIPNFGIGAFLYHERYYIGLSSPKILKTKFLNNYNNYSSWAEFRHFFLIGGYVFNLSRSLQFKPTFLARSIWGSSTVIDFSANFLLGEKVWLGGNYRTGDSFGFIAQWIFDHQLRIGYGVDYSTSRLQSFHSGSHEIMVSYELGVRRRWSTPRMF